MNDTDHPSFPIPRDRNVKIWRYMDIAKYISILQKKALFFPRANLLGDAFEGSATKAMVAAREYIVRNKKTDPRLVQFINLPDNYNDIVSGAHKNEVSKNCVSCWHMNEHESAAMWSLYMRSGEGVCIQTTYAKLREALPECVLIGEVRYIDYATEWFADDNMLNFIMHKRKSFEHERELRAVFWEVMGTEEARNYKSKLDNNGIWIDANLGQLLESVRISPLAPHWLFDVVANLNSAYSFNVSVRQSDLIGDPVY